MVGGFLRFATHVCDGVEFINGQKRCSCFLLQGPDYRSHFMKRMFSRAKWSLTHERHPFTQCIQSGLRRLSRGVRGSVFSSFPALSYVMARITFVSLNKCVIVGLFSLFRPCFVAYSRNIYRCRLIGSLLFRHMICGTIYCLLGSAGYYITQNYLHGGGFGGYQQMITQKYIDLIVDVQLLL